MKTGVKNEGCKGNIIMIDGFDITSQNSLKKYACRQFIQEWRVHVETGSGLCGKADSVFNMLKQQEVKFQLKAREMTAEATNTRFTSVLYPNTLSWDKAVEGCVFEQVHRMKQRDRFGKYEAGISELLDRFKNALYYALEQCKKLQKGHSVLVHMGTKDSGGKKKALNLDLEVSTWQTYFNNMLEAVLLIFRVKNEASAQNNEWVAPKLPTVHFTNKQNASMDQCFSWMTWTTDDIYNKSATMECHNLHIDFFLSLIDQTLGYVTYHCPLIAAVAMLTVDQTGFKSVRHVSSKVAGILTVFRMLLVYDSIREFIDEIEMSIAGKSLGGDDGRREVEDRAKMNAAQYLHIHDDSFMPNPLRELIRCVAVITNESKALEAAENILTWSSDKETVIYRGQFAISMSEFTGSIHSSINAMNKLLRQILGYDDLPPMSLHQIDDDLNNRRRGESFMHNLSNQTWLNTEYYMKKIVQKYIAWWDGADKIIEEKTILFQKQVDTFRTGLLALIHTTAGQPARGTELTNIAFENTSTSIRNIFIVHGCIHIRTVYHKTLMQTNQQKPISRYLPTEVGELLVYYLWLVVPFWRLVNGMLGSAAIVQSPYLFSHHFVLDHGDISPKDIWDTVKLSTSLRHLFGKEGMTVRAFRQIAIGIFNEKLGILADNDENTEDQVADLQAAHSTAVAKRHYATVANHEYNSFYNVSVAWHGFIMNGFNNFTGMTKQPLSGNVGGGVGVAGGHVVGDIGQDGGGDSVSSIGHIVGGIENASSFVRIDDNEWDDLPDNELCYICNDPPIVSIPAHRAPSATISELTGVDEAMQNHYIQRMSNQYEISEAQMLRTLRTILQNDSASFRGNQLETICSIIHRKYRCIFQICGTGVGKTTSFMIPVLLSNGGVTIVVAPLVALEFNHLKQAESCGISAVIWDGTTCELLVIPKLIFITPESIVLDAFIAYLARLQKDLLLDRFFVDECQLILESTASYRPSLQNMLTILQRAGVQMIYLSGTLPQKDLNTMLQLLGYNNTDVGNSVVVHRCKTARSNICYTVDYYTSTATMNQKIAQYLDESKGVATIIYVASVKVGVAVQQLLRGKYGITFGFYYSKTPENKNALLQNWMDDTTGPNIIIATTALGCGVHVPNIGLVLHVGTPFSFVAYVQGSGRAGRNGEPCLAVMLHNMSFTMKPEQEINGISEYVKPGQCRRVIIDKYMDDERAGCTCCEYPVQCEACDVCKVRLVSPVGNTSAGQSSLLPLQLLPAFDRMAPAGIVNPTPVPRPIVNKYAKKVRVIASVNDNNSAVSVDLMNGSNIHVDRTNTRATLVSNATAQLASEQEARRFHEQKKHIMVSMESLMGEWLNFFVAKTKSECLICKVHGLKVSGNQCNYHKPIKDQVEAQRKTLNTLVSQEYKHRTPDHCIPPFVVCFKRGCFVPQDFCDRKGKCFYADIILDVIHILTLKYPTEADNILRQVGGPDFVYRILTRYASYGVKHLLVHEIFITLCNKYVARP